MKKKILILGGGFGGVYAALRLQKKLAKEPKIEITLVSRDNFFLFTPMLHECAAADRGGLMTFVVAGGGFAGIETIASINDFVRDSLRFFPHIDPTHVKMIVVHPGDVILPELGPELGRYAQKKLTEREIEILTNVKVAEATDEGVTLTDGRHLPCKTLI